MTTIPPSHRPSMDGYGLPGLVKEREEPRNRFWKGRLRMESIGPRRSKLRACQPMATAIQLLHKTGTAPFGLHGHDTSHVAAAKAKYSKRIWSLQAQSTMVRHGPLHQP